ncbi:hypothetical protein GCM10008090_17110 [Arenicella chitinivorans]|uniref:Peptidase M14 domain-containing protein n=1 Tax=Arenicella chitinivorans TaxID=1329800 RepID=A0A918RQ42_9GAMM|nr:M14 family metallopeptidase [Arenicella chitinivorans]GHA07861.1 hypothetical protein GCM10008090_17110 [Arenicella chitinivorans]
MKNPTLLTAILGSVLAFSAPVITANELSTTETLQLLEQEKSTTNIYRAYYPSQALARKASITFHGQLLETNSEGGFLVLQLDPDDIEQLEHFGFKVQHASSYIKRRALELESSQQRMRNLQSFRSDPPDAGRATTDVSIQAIPGYPCYETVEDTFTAAQNLVSTYPQLAEWIDVGNSWEKTVGLGGYDIWVLKLTNQTTVGDKPILFANSAIHAREYTTAPLNLDFARWLLEGYGNDADATWILNHHEVHLMLQTNPDGRKFAESGLSWRKNTNQNFCSPTSNNRGVDLNRNFTFSWNSTNGNGSSGNQCSLTYRGPQAGSEPEIQAIEGYIRSLWPDRRGPNRNDAAPSDTSGIHIDIHSYSELVLWPWGDVNQAAPNGSALRTLGRKFAFFNGYTPQQSIGLYPTDGTSDSVSYGELGVAAYTFELGTSFFQACNTYENTILPDNLPALIYAAKVVRTPYLTPSGPDSINLGLSNNAANGGVLAGTPVVLTATATDTRFNNSNGSESTQAINAAEYYIDLAPWEAGASAITLSASDGNFNQTTESISGTINTSGLSNGQHIVYVRSRDSAGNWGAVSAIFLNITDTPPPSCSYEDNFTASTGWSNSPSATCSTGTFIRGNPNQITNGGVVTQVGGDAGADGFALFTASNSSAGVNDVDGGVCIATSPSIAVSDASTLSFDWFHGQRDTGDDSSGDYFRIEYSTDGGSNFNSIVNIGDSRTQAQWATASATIPAGSNVVLRISASDGPSAGDLVEGGIDSVSICPD